jgi:hypothetical protein
MSQTPARSNSPLHSAVAPQLPVNIRCLIELLELDAIECSRERLAQRDGGGD